MVLGCRNLVHKRRRQNPLQNNTKPNDFEHFLAPGGPGPVSNFVFNFLWHGLDLFGIGFNLGVVFVLPFRWSWPPGGLRVEV